MARLVSARWPERGRAPVALALALAVERVHLDDPHVEDRLDRLADLDLVGVGVTMKVYTFASSSA